MKVFVPIKNQGTKMKLEVEISDFAQEMLTKEGVLDFPAYVASLVAREATRLYHIHRSKPKPVEPRAPGRPRQTPLQKRVKELGDILREVYLRQREFYGEEFEAHFGEQERQLEEAIRTENLDVLLEFQNTQPWVRKKKNV
jgi:hypothetical protein